MKLWDKDKGWRNLLFSNWRDYIIFLMAILLILSNKEAYSNCQDIMNNPCQYCNCDLKEQSFLEVNISGAENTSLLYLGGTEDSTARPERVPE